MNLVGFDNYESLIKGIDKSKMVQVQVTVKGKNGTFTRKQWKRASDVSSSDTVISKPDDPSTKTPKKQDKPVGNSKQRLAQMLGSHSRDEVMDFAKKNGVQWTEHSHVGINWMRASIAIQKHIESNGDTWKSFEDGSQAQQTDTQKDRNSAQPDAKTDKVDKTSDTDKKTQKTVKKQTKPDKPTVDKDKSKKLVEKLGKDETLGAMKAKGITWKESDHKGINWMRAMQALGKHLSDNPNGFDELVATADSLKTKKDLQDTQKKVQDLQDLVSQLQNPTAQQMTQTAVKADILKGITTDTMSKYEKSHFGDAISKASPESLRNYRTLGMCAGDKESEEYLADLYEKYSAAINGNAPGQPKYDKNVDADPLRNKLQGVVNKMVVGVVKSSLKNARKRSKEFTMQQKLMEPWIDPNTPLTDAQKDEIKNPRKHGNYNGQTGALRQDACREQDGSHKMMHRVLDKLKLSKEYGALAEEYDQILTEFDKTIQNSPVLQNCVNQAGNGGRIDWSFKSEADAQNKVDRAIADERDKLQKRISWCEDNIKSGGNASYIAYQTSTLENAKKELAQLDALTVTGKDIMKAFELREKLFDPKFTDLNVNLYHHKQMGAQLAFQYFIEKDFVAEYPVLSKENLDKLDAADEDSLTNLSLYAGMFKPSLGKKSGKDAKTALMDIYAERQAFLDAYGGVTAVQNGSQYAENNEIKCKVSKVSDKKAKEITDKIAADWDKQSHGRMKYRIKGVYEVSGLAAEKDFDKIKKQHSQYSGVKSGGKDCGSDFFYHGTGSMATSLILGHSGEFKIVKAKVGRMLGDGIYLADKSSKSAQYIGDAGYSRSGISGSLMVVEASLGDTLHRRTSQGYNHDTVFAGKTDGLLNNEWCVHDTHAVIPRYLVQMEIL